MAYDRNAQLAATAALVEARDNAKILRRLGSVQRVVLVALRDGGRLWHPYMRSGGAPMLSGWPTAHEGRDIRYSTLDRLADLGLIEEIDDKSNDCHYRLTVRGAAVIGKEGT